MGMPGSVKRYTLSQLADATGMSARNVRAYQTRGLIRPPARDGRRAMYDETHLLRLADIQRARARGASLALIDVHLSEGGTLEAASPDLAGWLGPVRAPASVASADALLSAADDGQVPTQVVDALVRAGVLRRRGRRLLADRDLVAGARRLSRRGVPLLYVLDVALAAAEAAHATGTSIDTSVNATGPDERTRADLAHLAAAVFTSVLAGWSPPVAKDRPRNGSLRTG